MAEADANGSSKEDFEGGEVLVCGATDWALVGRSKDVRAEKYPNLDVPTRIKSLEVSASEWKVGPYTKYVRLALRYGWGKVLFYHVHFVEPGDL